MKTEWTKEMCSSRPLEFERVNPTTWIQRKDIQKSEAREDETDPGYICMSRFISDDIKDQIQLIEETVNTDADGSYDEGYQDGWDKGYEEGTEHLSEYEDGYQAAMILFGGAE